jgi:hypothetical protein
MARHQKAVKRIGSYAPERHVCSPDIHECKPYISKLKVDGYCQSNAVFMEQKK